MIRALAFLVFAASGLEGATVLTQSDGRIDIEIDGKPFSTFYYGPDAPKPYLHPLRSASGKVVTRRFPMEKVPSDGKDQHHRGVWLGYKDVNGFDFWENEFSYHNAHAGKAVMKKIEVNEGVIHGWFTWLDASGQPLLEEERALSFDGGADRRAMDVSIVLRASTKITLGDSKDGFFGVRLTEALSEKEGGAITNSNGGRGMKETWGKRADWVDYRGSLDGEKIGVAVLEHPSSFGHPTRWHVRDYGLLAANPFGSQAFDPQAPKASVTIEQGRPLRLRYRVVVHSGIDTAAIALLYEQFARDQSRYVK